MLSNQNPDLLRSEFKRRYLAEFSTYVGGLMEENSGHSANFLFMFLVLAVGPMSVPVAGLLGLGVSARYAQVQKSVKAAWSGVRKRLTPCRFSNARSSGERLATLPALLHRSISARTCRRSSS